MYLLHHIATWWKDWNHRRVMRSVRKNLAWLGIPCEHLSDEDIERALLHIGNAMAQTGMTMRQAVAGFEELGCTMRIITEAEDTEEVVDAMFKNIKDGRVR